MGQRGGVVCTRRLRITTKSKSCAPWRCATAEEAYIVPLDGPGCGHSKLWPTRAMLAVPAGGAIYMLFVAHADCALHQHTTDHLGPFVLDLSVIVDFAQHGIEMGNKFASRLWFTYSCMMSYAKTHPLRANASHTAVCLCDTPS